MISARQLALLACVLALASCATPPPPAQLVSPPPAHKVSLSRGLSIPNPCGTVFATGIMQIAEAVGEQTVSWCFAAAEAAQIAQAVRAGEIAEPVDLAGHSLGANAAQTIAHKLRDAGIRVGRVLLFDPTIDRDMTGFDATEFMSRDWRAVPVTGATIQVRGDLDHLQITTDPAVQAEALKLLNKRRAAP